MSKLFEYYCADCDEVVLEMEDYTTRTMPCPECRGGRARVMIKIQVVKEL